ncbi:hypothetical protein HDU87_004567 [Geranomyces variabilis]|uniref:C2H2-type domain-containing protein n=1 Tax=Geranomyces variabilis TaxID=109894 RepID=A0AAD5XLV3_9FUNG|nr:hypothetical protein HDU87_004567 [Geranomyces variabilis]
MGPATPTTLRERLERASVASSKKSSTKATKSLAGTPIVHAGEKRKAGTPASEKPTKRTKTALIAPDYDASPLGARNNPDSVVSKLRAVRGVAGTRDPIAVVVEDVSEDDMTATPRTLAERLKARERAVAKPGKERKQRREQSQERQQNVAVGHSGSVLETPRPPSKASKASAAVPPVSSPALPGSNPAYLLPVTPVTSNARGNFATSNPADSAKADPKVSTSTRRPSLPAAASANSKKNARPPRAAVTPSKGASTEAAAALLAPNPGSRSFTKKWPSRDLSDIPVKCTCTNSELAASPWGFLIACMNRDVCAGSTWYHPECVLPADTPDPATMTQAERLAHLKISRFVCESCLQTPPDWPAALTVNAAPPSAGGNSVLKVPLVRADGPLAAPPATTAAVSPIAPEQAAADKIATPAAAAIKPTARNANGLGPKSTSASLKSSRGASPATPQPGGSVALNSTTNQTVPAPPTPLPTKPGSAPQSTPILKFGVPGFGGFVPPIYSDEDEAGDNAAPVFEVLDAVKALLQKTPAPKAFKCDFPLCGAAYRYESGLRKHQQTHAKGVGLPFTCSSPGCEKQYITKQGLEYHNSRGKCTRRL